MSGSVDDDRKPKLLPSSSWKPLFSTSSSHQSFIPYVDTVTPAVFTVPIVTGTRHFGLDIFAGFKRLRVFGSLLYLLGCLLISLWAVNVISVYFWFAALC